MSLRFPLRSLFLVLGALSVPCLRVHSQQAGSITGVVREAERGPLLEGARVQLVGTKFSAITGRRGEFEFHGLPPGKYVIQANAIGYAALTSPLEVKAKETVEVEFQALPEIARLPELAVNETPNLPPDFMRRAESGSGRYLSRADIEKRNGITLGNLLRSFPGLRVDCRRYPCMIQQMRAPRNCPMAYWLDGAPVEAGFVMLQPTRELDGIEIYSGLAETPPELFQRNTCGAIAMWTRTPPPAGRRTKKVEPPPKPDTTTVGGKR